jgi:hypothetical protein
MHQFISLIARQDAVRVQALVRLSHFKRGAGPSAVQACETAEESLKAVSGVHNPRIMSQLLKLVNFAESVEDCRHVVSPAPLNTDWASH